jgi:excisionase family DNA binding protein
MMPEHNQHDPTEPSNALLNATGGAELLGVATRWVYAETRAGRLPYVRVGRYRRFRRSAVERWIKAHEKGRCDERRAATVRRHGQPEMILACG